MGIPSVKAKNAVKEKKVEGIKNIKELQPIEHLFEVFENPRKGQMRYSYGILRRYYDEWQHTGEVPVKTQPTTKVSNLEQIKGYIPKSLKQEFIEAIEAANAMSLKQATYGDVLAVAIREYLDRRFVDTGGD